MEGRFHQRLHIPFAHRLSNPVGHRGNAHSPLASVFLRYRDRTHWGWPVRSRRHAIPDLGEVVLPIFLEHLDRFSIDSSRSPIRLDSFVRLPPIFLERLNGFAGRTRSSRSRGCPAHQAGGRDPFAPSGFSRFPRSDGSLRPCASPRSAGPWGSTLGRLSSHRGDRFPRSAQRPEAESRHLYAGCHPGELQTLPGLVPGYRLVPGSTSSLRFRHVRGGSQLFVSLTDT